jgi:hypothetical protein
VAAELVRAIGALAVVLLLVATGCGASASAGEDDACGRAVLADWGEDGRIDHEYRDTCYLAAMDTLPEDLRAYTSAREDIVRALQAAGRGH